MPKSDIQHELSLRRGIKPKGWKFQLTNFGSINQVNYSTAINTISCQSVGMPRQNSLSKSFLYEREHLVKNWSPRFFGGLALHKLLYDLQMLSLTKLPQLRYLRLNAQNLPIWLVGRFSCVEKEFAHIAFGLITVALVSAFGGKEKVGSQISFVFRFAE